MPECICTVCRGRKFGMSSIRPSEEYKEIYEVYLVKMLKQHRIPKAKLVTQVESWKFHFDIMVAHALRHGGFWVYNMGYVKAEQFVRINASILREAETTKHLVAHDYTDIVYYHTWLLVDKFLNQLVEKYT